MAGIKRSDYLPYGESANALGGRSGTQGYVSESVRQGFGAYEEDSETGLDYAQARYMSPAQGRFASPDPLLASGRTTRPQSWNRYTYVLNNPLRFVDPNGLETVYLNNGFGPNGDIKGGKPVSIDAHGWTDEKKPKTITIGDIKITIPDFSNFKPNFYPVVSGDKGGSPTQHPDKRLVVVEEESAQLTITTKPADPSSTVLDQVKDAQGNLLVLNNFNFEFVLNRSDGSNIKDFTYDLDGTPINAATNKDNAGSPPHPITVGLGKSSPPPNSYEVFINVGRIETRVPFSATFEGSQIQVQPGYDNRVGISRPHLNGVPITRAPR